MKIMASYFRLVPVIGIPLFLISCALLWFFYPQINDLFKIHWLFLVGAILFALLPAGKTRLQNSAAIPIKPLGWFFKVILLQLCLYAVFLGISYFSDDHHFGRVTQTLLFSEGLYPWGFILLIAISAGYRHDQLHRDVYPHTLTEPLKLSAPYQVTIDYCSRLASLLFIASTFALICILWISKTAPKLITGFNFTPMLCGFLILIFTKTKFFKKQFKNTVQEKMPVVLGTYVWLIFLAVILWILNGVFSAFVDFNVTPPGVIQKWLHLSPHKIFLLFANGWWLFAAPIVGFLIADFSRGLQIRQMCGAVLILPVLGLLCAHFFKPPEKIPFFYIIAITSIGLLGLLIFILQKKNYGLFILNVLPAPGTYKYRSPIQTLIKTFSMTAGFIFLLLPSQFLLVNIFMLGLSLLLLAIFFLVFIPFWKDLFSSFQK